ncbi:MAG: hypothetical protein HKN81_07925 [Gammaproteobacteria bacterium]|nr:hypothetical protein [Gammaproteobacteria bacterium]
MLKAHNAKLAGLVSLLCALAFPVDAEEESLSVAELEAELAKRDAVIIELEQSLRQLRERVADVERVLQIKVDSDPRAVASGASNPSTEQNDSSRLVVDELAAERALERTLVQAGALLLPGGAIELVPQLSVTVSEFDFPVTADFGSGIESASVNVERGEVDASLTARFGLPFDSQFEISLPYLWVNEETQLSIGGLPFEETEQTGSGTGDITLAFSKTLLREKGIWPDIVGSIAWGSGGGDETDDGVFLGSGFESIGGSLSVVKRQDPLALLFSVGYRGIRESGEIAPGDELILSFGAALAVSPESSLFGSITQRSRTWTKISGDEVVGSDIDAVALNFGLSTILTRGALLTLFSEIGLSADAPEYSLGFTLPIRMR